MGFFKFAVASIIAGLIALWADANIGRVVAGLGLGTPLAANLFYKMFSWACMFGAVMVATPAPRRWANALVCALVLSVGLIQGFYITLLVIPREVVLSTYVLWTAVLALFALVLWPVWRWYSGLAFVSAD